jgi:hypothetical protein
MQPFENFQKHFFKHSNLRKINCVAYFVVLRREPIKWAQCTFPLSGEQRDNCLLTFHVQP